MNRYGLQLIDLLAAISLLLSFALLTQRRVSSVVNFYALQSLILAIAATLVGWMTGQSHLYWSAAITLTLKAVLIPLLLHAMLRRLQLRNDIETLIKLPTTMLLGLVLVVFAFDLARPLAEMSTSIASGTVGIALASVLLAFLMMITRSRALPQVIAFLAMENGVFFAATAATHGMPMVVELGIALDVLIGILILGVFLTSLHQQSDHLDINQVEALRRSGEEDTGARLADRSPTA
jgi:hydrogenase-4 component E